MRFHNATRTEMPSILRCLTLSIYPILALHLVRADVIGPHVEISAIETNITDDDVTETQHATCKIASEELVAHARATVTRVLTGACNAKTMDERFDSLERNLSKELGEIKMILREILDLESRSKAKRAENDCHDRFDQEEIKSNSASPRQAEIAKFNGTVHTVKLSNKSARVFYYYWQVKDFDEKLATWKTGRTERSSTFYVGPVGGYALYIKVTPRYFPDGTVFVGVGLTRGDYDIRLPWPFRQSIRLEILDHSPERLREDRRSRIWDPTTVCPEYFWDRPESTGEPDNPQCVGLSVPRQTILTRLPSVTYRSFRDTRHLWNGTLTVKLSIYL